MSGEPKESATFSSCRFNFLGVSYPELAFLHFEPLFIQTDDQMTPNPQELYGLFYVYDGHKGKVVADALCETKEFVRCIYQKILDFALSARENEDFIDDWCWYAYNEECGTMWDNNDPEIKNIFVNKVTSELIEKFLSDEDSTRRFIQIK